MRKIFLAVWTLAVSSAHAQTQPEPSFRELMEDLSNTGRWGPADEKGTVNYIDAKKRLQALQLPKLGKTLSLSRVMDTVKTAVNRNPLEHRFSKGDRWKGDVFNSDYIGVDYHGSTHSHLDGLTHLTDSGLLYNGISAETVTERGATRLGIEQYRNGIVSRAVLFDLPLLRQVDYLPSGTAITTTDLIAFENRFGVQVQRGDVVLVRTGRWKELTEKGPWEPFERATGLHFAAMQWLHHRQVAVLGSDGINDVFPSGIPEEPAPVHKLALVAMGMPLLDNLDLDALAAVAQKVQQWTFLITINPLYIEGATGSPVNPIIFY